MILWKFAVGNSRSTLSRNPMVFNFATQKSGNLIQFSNVEGKTFFEQTFDELWEMNFIWKSGRAVSFYSCKAELAFWWRVYAHFIQFYYASLKVVKSNITFSLQPFITSSIFFFFSEVRFSAFCKYFGHFKIITYITSVYLVKVPSWKFKVNIIT